MLRSIINHIPYPLSRGGGLGLGMPGIPSSRAFSCGNDPKTCPCKTPKLGLGLSSDLLIDPKEAVPLALHKRCNLKFVDASYFSRFSTGPVRDLDAEFNSQRIPGSIRFDFERFKNPNDEELVNHLPDAQWFEQFAREELGLNSSDHVIIYQRKGSLGGARAWWTFRLFGHNKVSYLNGGIDAWMAAGGAVESGKPVPTTPQKADFEPPFKAELSKTMVAYLKDVESAMQSGAAQILDARSKERFREGHIPGSLSLPYTSLFKEGDITTFRSPEEIRDAFVDSGMIFGSRAIFSCGSGISACVLALGLQIIGKDTSKSNPVFNGSWDEWSNNPNTPKANL